MGDSHDEGALKVADLLRRIGPILAGNSPAVQGAVLADLLAMWLAGHITAGGGPATDRLREDMLRYHLKAVRALVPVNAAHIHGGAK